jgi:hypothetical protein
MTRRPGASGQRFFELGALEREGALWYFTLSSAQCAIALRYGSEENARQARMLIFDALEHAVQPAASRSKRQHIPILLRKAIARLRPRRR